MRCSSDLRKRVMAFVKGGGSKAEAARRFQGAVPAFIAGSMPRMVYAIAALVHAVPGAWIGRRFAARFRSRVI
jgi:hypothetical protein